MDEYPPFDSSGQPETVTAIVRGNRIERTVFSIRNRNLYNPPMQGISWIKIAIGSLLLIAASSCFGQDAKSAQPETPKPPVKMEQRGRILGIGGVFFKSANRDQTREWYSKHLGITDKGAGAMLPWREHDDPAKRAGYRLDGFFRHH
jgi:hypothetical protein